MLSSGGGIGMGKLWKVILVERAPDSGSVALPYIR